MTDSETDPDICHDPTKHGPHSWGWRKGSPIQCPGSDVFRGENSALRGMGARMRARERNRWIEDHLVASSAWGEAVAHAHLYQMREEGLDTLMICSYPSCNQTLTFYGKPEVTS